MCKRHTFHSLQRHIVATHKKNIARNIHTCIDRDEKRKKRVKKIRKKQSVCILRVDQIHSNNFQLLVNKQRKKKDTNLEREKDDVLRRREKKHFQKRRIRKATDCRFIKSLFCLRFPLSNAKA